MGLLAYVTGENFGINLDNSEVRELYRRKSNWSFIWIRLNS